MIMYGYIMNITIHNHLYCIAVRTGCAGWYYGSEVFYEQSQRENQGNRRQTGAITEGNTDL